MNAAEPHPDTRPIRPDALPAGTLIDGCTIQRVIADSGFAIVYQARETGSDRVVAIKEYLPVSLALRSADGRGVALRSPANAEAYERGLLAFAVESRLLADHTDPALLPVLRSVPAHGTIYRVMPYCQGDMLSTLRHGMSGPPDEATVRRLLDGLLGALQTLHAAGIAHGDVSPANIMVLTDDRPLLLDTSAVRRALVADQTRALMAQLMPTASAPGGDAVQAAPDVAGDLYALGAVAYFCLTGRAPLAGAAYEPLASTDESPRSRTVRSNQSPTLLACINAALAEDAALRPADVAAFREALAGTWAAPPTQALPPIMGDERPLLPPTAVAERAAPRPVVAARSAAVTTPRRYPRRRGPRVVTCVVAAVFGVMIIGVGSWIYLRERDAQAERVAASATVLAPQPIAEAAPVLTPAAPPVTPPVLPAVALPTPMQPKAAAPVARAAPPAPAPALKAAPKPVAKADPGPASPREVCGNRTEFSLFRCMVTECKSTRWTKHAQCQRLRESDTVE